jgi:hypothetical protein
VAQPQPVAPPPPPPPPGDETDEGGLARVSLRIPESLKARAEEKAAGVGQSLNTWLVNLVRTNTNEHAINVDIDLSSIPFVGYDPFSQQAPTTKGRRMTGWV